MLTRAIHMTRSRFICYAESTLIPHKGIIKFTSTLTNTFTSNPKDTSTVKINEIIYNPSTYKFRITTTDTTQNDFMILWAVSANATTTNGAPTFSIVVEQSDGTILGEYPNSGSRTLSTHFGSTLVHLPTPPTATPVYYYFSLINDSQTNCYYLSNIYDMASILIMSIDTS